MSVREAVDDSESPPHFFLGGGPLVLSPFIVRHAIHSLFKVCLSPTLSRFIIIQ